MLDTTCSDLSVAGMRCTPGMGLGGEQQRSQNRGEDDEKRLLQEHDDSPGKGERVSIHFTRFILISLMSGSSLPSRVRSFDCQLIVSPSMRVTMFVADTFFPSR